MIVIRGHLHRQLATGLQCGVRRRTAHRGRRSSAEPRSRRGPRPARPAPDGDVGQLEAEAVAGVAASLRTSIASEESMPRVAAAAGCPPAGPSSAHRCRSPGRPPGHQNSLTSASKSKNGAERSSLKCLILGLVPRVLVGTSCSIARGPSPQRQAGAPTSRTSSTLGWLWVGRAGAGQALCSSLCDALRLVGGGTNADASGRRAPRGRGWERPRGRALPHLGRGSGLLPRHSTSGGGAGDG